MHQKLNRLRRAEATRQKLKKLHAIRLIVHRTTRHMYAQIISADAKVLVFASTLEKNINKNLKYTGNINAAIVIGKIIGERALKKNINTVSFDRSGFKYHGRIKALANAARQSGLKF